MPFHAAHNHILGVCYRRRWYRSYGNNGGCNQECPKAKECESVTYIPEYAQLLPLFLTWCSTVLKPPVPSLKEGGEVKVAEGKAHSFWQSQKVTSVCWSTCIFCLQQGTGSWNWCFQLLSGCSLIAQEGKWNWTANRICFQNPTESSKKLLYAGERSPCHNFWC